MPNVFTFSDVIHLLPWIVVALFAVLIPVFDVFAKPETGRAYAGYFALIGIGVAFLLNFLQWGDAPASCFSGMLAADAFGMFFNAVVLLAAALTTLLAIGYFQEHGLHRGEFYGLMLMALSGMMLMGMATDLISFFIALELMSIPVYALAAYMRHRNESVEAALKYFLMGAFSTAFMLMGIAFLYGAVGSTGFAEIHKHLSGSGASALSLLGVVFVLIGFTFKTAAVPFHMWTPDVYEGAPTPVTGFMAAAVKAAAFAAFIRVFAVAFEPVKLGAFGWYNIIWILAVLTMTLGNLAALVQDNVKRMLAYSSIAHAGYLLIGFLTITQAKDGNGAASLLFYLLGYAVMNLGAFGVVILFGRNGDENLDLTKGWKGMGAKAPALAVAMTVFMLSLAGIPPTVGFMGKFYIFKSALDQGLVVIAVLGVLNSLISVYYYLRVLVTMYMKPADGENDVQPMASLPVSLAVVASVALVLWLGILPSGALAAAQAAVASLF